MPDEKICIQMGQSEQVVGYLDDEIICPLSNKLLGKSQRVIEYYCANE